MQKESKLTRNARSWLRMWKSLTDPEIRARSRQRVLKERRMKDKMADTGM